jgi:phage gpG-like protein
MDIKIDLPDLSEWQKKMKGSVMQFPTVAATTAVNFYQQSFNSQGMYGKPRWKRRQSDTDQGRNVLIGKGSGALRRSIRQRHYTSGNATVVEVFTDQKHAQIHNEGGTYTPSAKQRAFFWAMHYQAKKDSAPTVGKRVNTDGRPYQLKANRRQKRASKEADMWLAMAMAKTITMPQRQFMDIQAQGISPSLVRLIEIKVKKIIDEV